MKHRIPTASEIQATMDLLKAEEGKQRALWPTPVFRGLRAEDVIREGDVISVRPFKGTGPSFQWYPVTPSLIGKSPADWRISNFVLAGLRP